MPWSRTKHNNASDSDHKHKDKNQTIIEQPKGHTTELKSEMNHQEHLGNEQPKAGFMTPTAMKNEDGQSVIEEPIINSIASHVKRFLQQQADYAWLMAPYSKLVESDHFHSSVVYSTFPTTLDPHDFDYYIDMTFSDLSENLRTRMKSLYHANTSNPSLEDITCVNHTDGTITAILVQILTQQNDRNELEMLVGSVCFTRKLPKGYYLHQVYWEPNKERIKSALQYIYGREAKKELPYKY